MKTINVTSETTGTIWKIEACVGQAVQEGETIAIIESMKMEIPIEAPCAGVIREIRFKEGELIEEAAIFAVMADALP